MLLSNQIGTTCHTLLLSTSTVWITYLLHEESLHVWWKSLDVMLQRI